MNNLHKFNWACGCLSGSVYTDNIEEAMFLAQLDCPVINHNLFVVPYIEKPVYLVMKLEEAE